MVAGFGPPHAVSGLPSGTAGSRRNAGYAPGGSPRQACVEASTPSCLHAPLSATEIAGRAAELATLDRAWEDALAGERRFVLISGEQGIGKTRLAAEFAASVHGDSSVVLYGRSETDREISYQPFAEALRWYWH